MGAQASRSWPWPRGAEPSREHGRGQVGHSLTQHPAASPAACFPEVLLEAPVPVVPQHSCPRPCSPASTEVTGSRAVLGASLAWWDASEGYVAGCGLGAILASHMFVPAMPGPMVPALPTTERRGLSISRGSRQRANSARYSLLIWG